MHCCLVGTLLHSAVTPLLALRLWLVGVSVGDFAWYTHQIGTRNDIFRCDPLFVTPIGVEICKDFLDLFRIVFNTREGCVASLSMLGIIFDTREEGEGARKKSQWLKAYIKAYIPQQKSTMISYFCAKRGSKGQHSKPM